MKQLTPEIAQLYIKAILYMVQADNHQAASELEATLHSLCVYTIVQLSRNGVNSIIIAKSIDLARLCATSFDIEFDRHYEVDP